MIEKDTPSLILASASPQRRMLLQQLGLQFVVKPADIDEQQQSDENVKDFVRRLANEKAGIVYQRERSTVPVLGADTVVYCDGDILGKPADRNHALAMLQRLSGRSHEVYTGAAIVTAQGTKDCVVCTQVTMRPLSEYQRIEYWQTGECRGRAGAYAIQGLGALLISAVAGSYTNVVGLPLYEVGELLEFASVNPLTEKLVKRNDANKGNN